MTSRKRLMGAQEPQEPQEPQELLEPQEPRAPLCNRRLQNMTLLCVQIYTRRSEEIFENMSAGDYKHSNLRLAQARQIAEERLTSLRNNQGEQNSAGDVLQALPRRVRPR